MGGSVAGSRERGGCCGGGGGGILRHRFSVDLEGIVKRFKTIFGYFRL